MLVANVLVYGWYFNSAIDIAAAAFDDEKSITIDMFAWNLIVAVVLLIAIAIVSHIIIAIHGMVTDGEVDDTEDERDTLIKLRGENKSGPILGLGVVITIAMILLGQGPFWTANALLAALVLSETVAGAFKLLDYRRSF